MASSEAWVQVEVGEVLAQTNNGQGDCLFVAVSEQLDGQISPLALREMAVQFLTEHRQEFQEELLSLGWDMLESREICFELEGDLLIDAVLQVLGNPWTWGGAECIAALGLALDREIRVYQENGPTINFPRGDEPPLRILLRYPRGAVQRRTHYESVIAWRPQSSTTSARASRVSTSTPTQETDSVHEVNVAHYACVCASFALLLATKLLYILLLVLYLIFKFMHLGNKNEYWSWHGLIWELLFIS